MKPRRMALLAAAIAALLLAGRDRILADYGYPADGDEALIQAVKRLDAPAAVRLLNAGAHADAAVPSDAVNDGHTLSGGPGGGGRLTPLLLLMRDDRIVKKEKHQAFDAIEAGLIVHGADIGVRGNLGEQPLADAANWGLHRTLDALIGRHVNVNDRDAYGQTALMGADAYATAKLVSHGAQVNASDAHQMTALYHAESLPVARILIAHGAKVNAVTDSGATTLDHVLAGAAGTHQQGDLIRYLRAHGALTSAELRARRAGAHRA